ncbi:MAG: hypothetical protein HY365_03205 [Candidatus Aenigmarchaeota archaeon]|nr:hypothetical protein [Candidatus Aenigmarchaeota archaeon]
MDYYDLHVRSVATTGENTSEEMAAMAACLGLSAIAVPDATEKTDGVEIVSCHVIEAKNVQEMAEEAQKYRNKCEILMVSGGTYDVNRAACENSLIDVLCHPGRGRHDSGLDHVAIKAAADNNVAIEINFREILESYRKNRVRVLEGMKRNVFLCRKFNTPIVITSGAHTKWGMRAGRELAAVGVMAGMELANAIDSVSTVPQKILETNRAKLSGKKWEGMELE